MKTKNISRNIIKRVVMGLLAVTLGLNFTGCSKESPFQTADNPINSPASGLLNKEPSPTALTTSAMINNGGGTLSIKGHNINDGEFCVAAQNLDTHMRMTLTKLSKESNTYHLEPFGIDLPRGVKITLDYDHSAMPFGVKQQDLQIFYLTDTDTVALRSTVRENRRQVEAVAFSTGEFALGAYNDSGKLLLIEGEYGLRSEGKVNPNKDSVIRLGGGSELFIPKGAVNEQMTIGIIAERATIQGKSDGKAFLFTPHGTTFNTPIALTLSWKEFEGMDVILYYFNELTGEWEVNGEGVWDAKNQTVTIYLHHFSRYALAHS